MADALRQMGLVESFRELHHFSQPQFKSKKPTLNTFCLYCDKTADHKEVSENPQTIRRTTAFIELVRSGTPHDQAVATVWKQFPLVTR